MSNPIFQQQALFSSQPLIDVNVNLKIDRASVYLDTYDREEYAYYVTPEFDVEVPDNVLKRIVVKQMTHIFTTYSGDSDKDKEANVPLYGSFSPD